MTAEGGEAILPIMVGERECFPLSEIDAIAGFATGFQSGFRTYGKQAIGITRIDAEEVSAGSEIRIQISDHRLKMAKVSLRVHFDFKGTYPDEPVPHGKAIIMSRAKFIIPRLPHLSLETSSLAFCIGKGAHRATSQVRTLLDQPMAPSGSGGRGIARVGCSFLGPCHRSKFPGTPIHMNVGGADASKHLDEE